MMKHLLSIIIIAVTTASFAQKSSIYQKPPKEILDLVDVSRAPSVLMNDDKSQMVLLYRNSHKSIEELSKEEMRLGGLRIDPKTNIGSRVTYINNVKLKKLDKKEAKIVQVEGLPENPKLTNFKWSPDQSKIALTNTTSDGVELWVLDIESASVSKITEANLNANIGNVIHWFEDGASLLVKMISKSRKPLINTKTAVPTGPTFRLTMEKRRKTEPIKIYSKTKMMSTILNN